MKTPLMNPPRPAAVRRRRRAFGPAFSLGLLLAFGAGITGCTPSVAVRVDSDVPEPLIEKYPVTVGVRYSDELADHTFIEASEERPDWTIATGASQTAMFDQLSKAMFERVARLDSDPTAVVDAVLEPVISDIQFATPGETRLEFFEAWIKYDIRLTEPSGELIGDWVITAYGRAPQALFKGKESGLTQA
ncbi:MAG: hypothetical protein HKO62_04390, partial [Gammaproteobacteria bacterium]|nr:hypothetical protein [Gammaproteobacteria bacterium]